MQLDKTSTQRGDHSLGPENNQDFCLGNRSLDIRHTMCIRIDIILAAVALSTSGQGWFNISGQVGFDRNASYNVVFYSYHQRSTRNLPHGSTLRLK